MEKWKAKGILPAAFCVLCSVAVLANELSVEPGPSQETTETVSGAQGSAEAVKPGSAEEVEMTPAGNVGDASGETAGDTAAADPTAYEAALGAVTDFVTAGKFFFYLRPRAELAQRDGLDFSQAYTWRLALAYETAEWKGFSGFFELQNTSTADGTLYNSLLNGETGRTVIADPATTNLNQFFGRYRLESVPSEGVVGRREIVLDDHRFVGNVLWRQQHQSFDSATAQSSLGVEGLNLFYAYVWRVNRILGPDGPNFQSDSNLFNLSYAAGDFLKLTGFTYILNFSNAALLSSNTFGVRATGSPAVTDRFKIAYAASYAYQESNRINPQIYNAHYYFLEAKAILDGRYQLGPGYEVLGAGNGTIAFSTPLATLHKFNGFADAFLITPPGGLQDLYFMGGVLFPWEIDTRLIFHWFWEQEGGQDLGNEVDLVARKAFNEHLAALLKFASFDGKRQPDLWRFWFQLEIKFSAGRGLVIP